MSDVRVREARVEPGTGGTGGSGTEVARRPTQRMTRGELFQISVYWLALNATWGGIDLQILPARMTSIVCGDLSGAACVGHEQAIFAGVVVSKELATAVLGFLGALVALFVQPIAAAISDYTSSRWGRRKPYIFVGTLLDAVFLVGLATSNTFLAILAFLLLLQASSNLAQGPFQGYVPDLVPEEQVGVASGVMGVMVITGNFLGIAAAGIAIALGDFRLGLAAIAVIELSTMITTVVTVREPRSAPPPRQSADLRGAVVNTARAVLSHRSFLWLLASRICFLVAISLVTRLAQFYMQDAIGLTPEQAALAVVVAGGLILVSNGLAAYPSAILSDRLGRKAMIYVACALGIAGMIPLVLAPRDPAFVVATVGGYTLPETLIFPVAGLAVLLVGTAAGTFYAVDWALVTDIIPKDTTARYMGISNVVNAMAGPIALALGGVVITIVNVASFGLGPRAAFALAAVAYLLSAVLLRPVDARRWEDVHGTTSAGPHEPMEATAS